MGRLVSAVLSLMAFARFCNSSLKQQAHREAACKMLLSKPQVCQGFRPSKMVNKKSIHYGWPSPSMGMQHAEPLPVTDEASDASRFLLIYTRSVFRPPKNLIHKSPNHAATDMNPPVCSLLQMFLLLQRVSFFICVFSSSKRYSVVCEVMCSCYKVRRPNPLRKC